MAPCSIAAHLQLVSAGTGAGLAKGTGRISVIEARNSRKADKLYAAIDASSFYSNPVDPIVRSRMNVPFLLANTDLEKAFLAQAKEQAW